MKKNTFLIENPDDKDNFFNLVTKFFSVLKKELDDNLT
jgi:hypothetical protein